MSVENPDFILFAQHGWADNRRAIADLVKRLATSETIVIAPSLGYFKTWLRIESLIETVEEYATVTLDKYPNTPMRIIGHSMGGLIWLEILNLHPEWHERVHSLVLIASPLGGASLGRIFDPFNIGIGISRDLGKNRRAIAEQIAASILALVIAGNVDGGGDGTIAIGSTKVRQAHFICLSGLSHPVLRNHPRTEVAIGEFWSDPQTLEETSELTIVDEVIQRLQSVPGMIDAHQRDFHRAKAIMTLKDGSSIRLWWNLVGVEHIFVASPQGEFIYGGFVGWIHVKAIQRTLKEIKQIYAAEVSI
jgi:pimeloyl-ACP methyl ester carboxylesterase